MIHTLAYLIEKDLLKYGIKDFYKIQKTLQQFLPNSFNHTIQKYSNFLNKDINRFKLYEKEDLFEIKLIGWKPNATSSIHDHSKYGCVYYMLQGSLNEKRYHLTNLTEYSHNQLKLGDINYIDNTIGYHAISNQTNMNAFSLHIYSHPNYDCRTIETSNQFIKPIIVEDNENTCKKHKTIKV